jgi:hypothetical protein
MVPEVVIVPPVSPDPAVMLVTVPPPPGVCHVPSPLKNVEEDALPLPKYPRSVAEAELALLREVRSPAAVFVMMPAVEYAGSVIVCPVPIVSAAVEFVPKESAMEAFV